MCLSNGTVWSIPITLADDEQQTAFLEVGVTITLIGEDDNVSYGLLEVQSVYTADQEKEARRVIKTDGPEQPGDKAIGTTCNICGRTNSSLESS